MGKNTKGKKKKNNRAVKQEKKQTSSFVILLAAVLMLALAILLILWLLNRDGPKASQTDTPVSASETGKELSKIEIPDVEECFEEHVGSQYHHVEIDVKDYGTICLELDETIAPITVANFIKLAEDGFYDGLTFHRIMTGFMIQGGDPEGTGMGGSKDKIKGEFSVNGYENPLSHTRGVLSMARASYSYDSASSQFFIVQKDSVFLDGQYAAFGYVTRGIGIVDAICAVTPVLDDNGTVAPQNQPVMECVKVID